MAMRKREEGQCRFCGIDLPPDDRYKACDPCRENETARRNRYRDLIRRKVRPNPWAVDAACRGMDTAEFYPGREDSKVRYEMLRALCARCPVKVQCLEDALYYERGEGIYPTGFRGGMSAKERLHEARRRASGRAGQVFTELRAATA